MYTRDTCINLQAQYVYALLNVSNVWLRRVRGLERNCMRKNLHMDELHDYGYGNATLYLMIQSDGSRCS